MTNYRVTAPLVYVKVPDVSGSLVSYAYYKDAVLPSGADSDSVQHHLDLGMVEEIPEAEPEKPARSRSSKSE